MLKNCEIKPRRREFLQVNLANVFFKLFNAICLLICRLGG